MQPHMENPATLAACGAPKSDLAGASITSESKSSASLPQDLILAVFGRSYVVVHETIGDRFRKRAPSRIRAWRAPA
jgi:hypothetical protein